MCYTNNVENMGDDIIKHILIDAGQEPIRMLKKYKKILYWKPKLSQKSANFKIFRTEYFLDQVFCGETVRIISYLIAHITPQVRNYFFLESSLSKKFDSFRGTITMALHHLQNDPIVKVIRNHSERNRIIFLNHLNYDLPKLQVTNQCYSVNTMVLNYVTNSLRSSKEKVARVLIFMAAESNSNWIHYDSSIVADVLHTSVFVVKRTVAVLNGLHVIIRKKHSLYISPILVNHANFDQNKMTY